MEANLLTNANSLKLARLYGFASFTSFHCFLRVQEIPNQKRGCANHAYSNMTRISSPAAPPGGERRIGPNMDFSQGGRWPHKSVMYTFSTHSKELHIGELCLDLELQLQAAELQLQQVVVLDSSSYTKKQKQNPKQKDTKHFQIGRKTLKQLYCVSKYCLTNILKPFFFNIKKIFNLFVR